MARAFLWRNRLVEIQTHYHDYRVSVSVKIDEQEIGSYDHFEEAMSAVRAMVLGNDASPPLVETSPEESHRLREHHQAR
ncbi:MAG: hypothetical protein SNJ60_00115 [Pseudanabaenaceae cyanobacterium]